MTVEGHEQDPKIKKTCALRISSRIQLSNSNRSTVPKAPQWSPGPFLVHLSRSWSQRSLWVYEYQKWRMVETYNVITFIQHDHIQDSQHLEHAEHAHFFKDFCAKLSLYNEYYWIMYISLDIASHHSFLGSNPIPGSLWTARPWSP